MSCKSALSNSIKSNSETLGASTQAQGPQWVKQSSTETNVKLAGEEAKDRLYEPKHKKKLVRVLTVVAYIFSVSLAAIMLSLYYIFIWNPYSKAKLLGDGATLANKQMYNNCPELRHQEALAQIKVDDSFTMTATSVVDEDVGGKDNDNNNDDDDDTQIASASVSVLSTSTQDSLEFENFYDEASSSETKIEMDTNDIDNINIESYENNDNMIYNKTT